MNSLEVCLLTFFTHHKLVSGSPQLAFNSSSQLGLKPAFYREKRYEKLYAPS